MKTTGILYSNTDPMLVPICAKNYSKNFVAKKWEYAI